MNNPKNLISNASVYKICCHDYKIIYIGKTSRNLNVRIYELNDFKNGNTTNSLVSYNISTNHTFDFKNSTIFAFIHDRDKHAQ